MTTAARVVDGRSPSRPGSGHQHDGDGERPDDRGQLRLRPGGLGDRGARRAAADRHARRRSPWRGSRHRGRSARGPGSTSSPRRIDSVRDRTLVSVAETSAIPSAAGTQGEDVAQVERREGQRRQPDRERADRPVSPVVAARSRTRAQDRRADDRDQDPGDLGSPALEAEDDGQAADADRERDRVRLAGGHARRRTLRLRRPGRRASTLKPNSLRELADDDDQRDAVQVADRAPARRAGRSGTRAGRSRPRRRSRPTMTARSAPASTALVLVSARRAGRSPRR